MSWQRINENTYIDDTLVTCAEYQLFIDEMREQGRYYQPDHWTTYQFPKGQAQNAILGVRFSDATAFCGWLCQPKDTLWKYRLPQKTETTNKKVKYFQNQLSIGYWRGEDNIPFEFEWVDEPPSDARVLDFSSIVGHFADLTKDQISKYPQGKTIPNFFQIWLNTIYGAEQRALSLDYYRKLDELDYQFSDSYPHLYDAMYLDLLNNVLPRNNPRDREHNINDALEHVLSDLFVRGLGVHDFNLLIDIFTVYERIAGRSPAFEGIRLVKERIP